MLKDDIQQHIRNYDFLLGVLDVMIDKTTVALKNDNRWFMFAPRVCQKFLNQAITLKALFLDKTLEINDKREPFEDVSVVYSTLRMQFETHGLFFHLFMPSANIEENILRFRLWELDGIRTKIRFRDVLKQTEESALADQRYLPTIERSISDLRYFQALDPQKQRFLLQRGAWRFTEQSLKEREKNKWQISYEQLIKNTGIREEIYRNLYSHFSMHTHPGYIGVVQSVGLTSQELEISKYVTLLYACFVTSFLITDFSTRFEQSKTQYENLSKNQKDVIQSFVKGGRN